MPMPHNSCLVMLEDCQEAWLHAVPKVSRKGIAEHPTAGLTRISLTFRMARPQFAPQPPVLCKCGVPATLKSKNLKYFLYCDPTKVQTCGFWEPCEWADAEARRLREISSLAAAAPSSSSSATTATAAAAPPPAATGADTTATAVARSLI